MIFNTLYPHAKFFTEKKLVGQDCFVLKDCSFIVDDFKESFESNLRQSKPKKKLHLPILFHGEKKKAVPGRYCLSGAANASKHTFQTIKDENRYPQEWFPWVTSRNKLKINNFIELLQNLNKSDLENIKNLFAFNGSLFTFQPNDSDKLFEMVSSSVCQPVTCKTPKGLVHSILALNALNIKANLFGQTTDSELIPAHAFKFCLMFWMLNKMMDKKEQMKIYSEDSSNEVEIDMMIEGAGTVGNISSLPLFIDIGHCWLGMHTDFTDSDHPVIRKFVELTQEKEVDSVKIGSKTYTAPATGKSPTNNACRTRKGEQALSPEVRLGFNKEKITPVLASYTNLTQNTRFVLSKTALSYYVFPEDHLSIGQYVKFLEDMIRQTEKHRKNYSKASNQSAKSKKANKEKQEALNQLQKSREEMWSKLWNGLKLSNLFFAFEENVGSTNQAQYSWTRVYRNLPAARAFMFLNMLDDPEQYGRLAKMFAISSKNLSESWKDKEIKRLSDHYFLNGSLNQLEYWLRWRRYITRNNFNLYEFDPGLWQNSMSLIIQLRAMLGVECSNDISGSDLLKSLEKRRGDMNQKNLEAIQGYLDELFSEKNRERSDSSEEKQTKKVGFTKAMAESYSSFVDTSCKGWEVIVDGLICGWGLKMICRTIRGKEYTTLIGGKNLSKHTPSQLRTLMFDLHNKAERSGSPPWNVQVPEEIAFKWSQKGGNKPETQIFMDAVFLGFMRWDSGVTSSKGNDVINNPDSQEEL